MRIGNPRQLLTPGGTLFATVNWISLTVGYLLAAIWVYSSWCSFPGNPWNDIRVAPAVALHHGISVYSLPGAGPVSTWTYGPLPLFILWPSGLASSAIGAIQLAGAIHIGTMVFALALTCAFWPAALSSASQSLHRHRRLAAALLCVLVVPKQTYVVFASDAPGIAFALLALLTLSRSHLWTAATCAVAAAACKQTLIGIALAQLLWLYMEVSPRAMFRQGGRILLASAVFGIAAACLFGASELWHVMIELPRTFPWAGIPGRIKQHIPHLVFHVALPVGLMVICRGFFFRRKSPALLPAIAFLCTLPLSLAAFFKNGGNVNSLHSFFVWFPPTLTILLTGAVSSRWGQTGNVLLATGTAVLASFWLHASDPRLRPNIEAYQQAAILTRQMPEKIWFPLHPLITLYSDRRLYHDLDGLCVRKIVGQRLTDAQFLAHIPHERQASATLLPVGWGLFDVAEARLPLNAPMVTFGLWRLDGHID